MRAEFADQPIFKDVDDVPLGANWKSTVRKAVLDSAVVIIVMGRSWQYTGAIQIEVETALDAGLPIIPLLVNGARIEEVTGDIHGKGAVLAELNAASVDHSSWNRDLIPVMDALRTILAGRPQPTTRKPPRPSTSREARRPKPRDAHEWTAELVALTEQSFSIEVQLSTSPFRVEWRSGWITNTVTLDGKTVSTRPAVTSHETHLFELPEGHRRHEATLEIDGALILRRIALTVDSYILFESRPPFSVRP